MNDYKRRILGDNITAREQELAMYDINIANYTFVLGMEPEEGLADFRAELKTRLVEERFQRRKSEVILIALNAQLAALTDESSAT